MVIFLARGIKYNCFTPGIYGRNLENESFTFCNLHWKFIQAVYVISSVYADLLIYQIHVNSNNINNVIYKCIYNLSQMYIFHEIYFFLYIYVYVFYIYMYISIVRIMIMCVA